MSHIVDNTANTHSRVKLAVTNVLRPYRALRERLKAREDTEHEQAILRIVLVALVLTVMGFTYSRVATDGGYAESLLVFGLTTDLILAIALFIGICLWPAESIPRRVTGMLADAGAATFCMFLTGETGVSMIGIYLFITFGNGFRYGRTYLFACQALCLLGFYAVLIYAPYWEQHRVAGWCLMIALVVLPLYVSTLLKRIQESRARAEEANRAKTSFLANMSHEMRTPLNGIVGVADLLQTTKLNPQQAELMRLLRHSVILLRSLVDDVLDISKIEAGRLTIEIADFDLHATLNGLIQLLRQHAQAKGLALRAMVDPAIDYHVRGDSHHLRQVLLNLLSNAIKFTERGEITVEVMLLAETDEGLKLRFEVRDTGIGIGDAVQERIFERFVQADDSTTRRYGGTGLGTTIAKQVVELMGGTIGLTSTVGVGSTFWFEVPLLKTISGGWLTPGVSEAVMETKPTAAILIARPLVKAEAVALVESACGRVDLVASGDAAIAQLRTLEQQGISVTAVIVAADTNTACDIFERLANECRESPTAMIHLSQTPPTDISLARLRLMDGVCCLNVNTSPRVLRNAIHAATTGGLSESAEIIDLGQVLEQQRQPLKILVAEDNATNQTIIRKLLESAGHTVLLASDGEQALDIYEEGDAELAILDFNMPERNGLEVVTAIRTMEPIGTRLPVIILSASVTKEAREHVRQAGADEFVGKPFEAAALLQVIDRVARRAGRGLQARPRHFASGQGSTIALIDYTRMQEVERISRDAAFLKQLLGGFRGDVESLLMRLDTAIAGEQRAAIMDIVHAIRGAALSIGAQQLALQCTRVEEAASNGHIVQLRNLAEDMRRCFDETAAQLNDYTLKKGTSQ